jgi:hypothetical protein
MSQTDPVPDAGAALLLPPRELEKLHRLDVRVWPRFSVPPGATCRLTTVTGRQAVTAAVTNVSCGGVRFLVETSLAPGTCLMAEMRSRSGLFVRLLLTHVIYCTPAEGDRFALGAEFLEPLGPEELRLLLA